MRTTIVTLRGVIGITGLVQIVLGLLLWTGHATNQVGLHMSVGFVFVLALLLLASLAGRIGAPLGLVATAWAWGLLIPILGMTQMHLWPGPYHWIVRVAHLATGLVGMGLAGRLFESVRTRPALARSRVSPPKAGPRVASAGPKTRAQPGPSLGKQGETFW